MNNHTHTRKKPYYFFISNEDNKRWTRLIRENMRMIFNRPDPLIFFKEHNKYLHTVTILGEFVMIELTNPITGQRTYKFFKHNSDCNRLTCIE